MEKRTDIQGIRAWSVISVVLFHFFPVWFPRGYFGVDIFFVLSGFLISLVLDGKKISLDTLKEFYFKRLRRIFPLALLIIFINVLAYSILMPGTELKNGFWSAKMALFFISNLKEHTVEEDYFNELENANNLFTHYWSLSVEIQFYIFAPFLIFVLSQQDNNNKSETMYKKYVILTGIVICSLYFSMKLPQHVAFSSTFARLWQFIFGIFAFQIVKVRTYNECLTNIPKYNNINYFFLCFGLILISGAFVLDEKESFLRCAIAFSISIMLTVQLEWKIFTHAALQKIGSKIIMNANVTHKTKAGDASFSLYLIHWPVVCLMSHFGLTSTIYKLIGVVACIATSIIIHEYFEKWCLRLTKSASLIMIFFLYAICFLVLFIRSSSYLSVNDEMLLVYPTMKWKLNQSLSEEESNAVNAFFEKVNSQSMRFPGCKEREGSGKNPFAFCDLKSGNGSMSFLILGNSYAANIGPLVIEHFREHYSEIHSRSIPQCEPLFLKKDLYCRDPINSRKEFDLALETIKPDVLFLISRFLDTDAVIQGEVEDDSIFQEIQERVAYFEQYVHKKLIIMQATPLAARLVDLEKYRRGQGLVMLPYMPEGIESDSEPMRRRILKVAKYCKKCVVFDVTRLLQNVAGNFTVIHPISKLRLFDRARHFTPVGLTMIEPMFREMSGNFSSVIASHFPRNVID